jgi:hypothetical protein
MDGTERTGQASGKWGWGACQKHILVCGFSEPFLSLPNDPLGKRRKLSIHINSQGLREEVKGLPREARAWAVELRVSPAPGWHLAGTFDCPDNGWP